MVCCRQLRAALTCLGGVSGQECPAAFLRDNCPSLTHLGIYDSSGSSAAEYYERAAASLQGQRVQWPTLGDSC